MIISNDLATSLLPIRIAGAMEKTLFTSKAPFLRRTNVSWFGPRTRSLVWQTVTESPRGHGRSPMSSRWEYSERFLPSETVNFSGILKPKLGEDVRGEAWASLTDQPGCRSADVSRLNSKTAFGVKDTALEIILAENTFFF